MKKPSNTSHLTPTSHRIVSVLAGLTLALTVASSARAAGRNPNPGVLPVDANPYGQSYGNWGAAWWIWALQFPLENNPITDPTGALSSQGQSGPVWFLAGTFGGTAARTLTVPRGKALFFPLFNIFNDYPCPDPNFQPAPGQTLEEFLTEGAAANIDLATDLFAEVDGVPLQELWNYRAHSDLVTFTGHPSLVAIDPCLTGEPQPAVADGYWVLLAPLRPGQHTVRFGSKALFGEFQFEVDVTYHLTVE